MTGEPIPPARLKTVPWTRFCEDAELALEKHEAVNRRHPGELISLEESN